MPPFRRPDRRPVLDTQSFSLLEAGETPLYGAMLERGRPVLVKVWDGDECPWRAGPGAGIRLPAAFVRRLGAHSRRSEPEGRASCAGARRSRRGAVPAGGECLPRPASAPRAGGGTCGGGAGHACGGRCPWGHRPAHILARADGGRVWLTGFAHATARGQVPEGGLPDPSADALPYMSPEHTGRTGRIVDERSVCTVSASCSTSFWRVCCRFMPAPDGVDPCPRGRVPAPPRERADLPEAVSAIVVKLLAKEPASRYQSAATLEQDLRRCVATLRQRAPFRISCPARARCCWQPHAPALSRPHVRTRPI